MASQRLTEQDVHNAAQTLIDDGQQASALAVFKQLERGSLTTITKHLKTFHNERVLIDEPLQALHLPDHLSQSAQKLIEQMWQHSNVIAHEQLLEKEHALITQEKALEKKAVEQASVQEEQLKTIDMLKKDLARQDMQIHKLQASMDSAQNKIDKQSQKITESNQKILSLSEQKGFLEGQIKVYAEK